MLRVVGLPGAGKSWFRRALADALGLPDLGIDDMRSALLRPGQSWPWGRDEIAWANLGAAIAVQAGPVVLENAGVRDMELLGDRPVLTFLCRADLETRRRRLEERVRVGYRFARGRARYVEQVLVGQEMPLEGDEVLVDTADPASVSAAIDAGRAWLGSGPAPRGATARVAWPGSPARREPRRSPRPAPADWDFA